MGNFRLPGPVCKFLDHLDIANKVYANRNGNGAVASGDGWRFRGRGFIQVTGRSNYRQVTQQYTQTYPDKIDFEATPGLMETFPHSLRAAVCFWLMHGMQTPADRGSTPEDVDRITDAVNKGTTSREDRQANFVLAINAFR